jgi:hypothetical protein
MAHLSKLCPVSTRSTGSLRRDFVIGQRNSLGQGEADAGAAGRVSLSVARAFPSACRFGSDALVDCAMVRKLLSGTLERTVFSCKPGQHAFLCKRRSWILQSRAMGEQCGGGCSELLNERTSTNDVQSRFPRLCFDTSETSPSKYWRGSSQYASLHRLQYTVQCDTGQADQYLSLA